MGKPLSFDQHALAFKKQTRMSRTHFDNAKKTFKTEDITTPLYKVKDDGNDVVGVDDTLALENENLRDLERYIWGCRQLPETEKDFEKVYNRGHLEKYLRPGGYGRMAEVQINMKKTGDAALTNVFSGLTLQISGIEKFSFKINQDIGYVLQGLDKLENLTPSQEPSSEYQKTKKEVKGDIEMARRTSIAQQEKSGNFSKGCATMRADIEADKERAVAVMSEMEDLPQKIQDDSDAMAKERKEIEAELAQIEKDQDRIYEVEANHKKRQIYVSHHSKQRQKREEANKKFAKAEQELWERDQALCSIQNAIQQFQKIRSVTIDRLKPAESAQAGAAVIERACADMATDFGTLSTELDSSLEFLADDAYRQTKRTLQDAQIIWKDIEKQAKVFVTRSQITMSPRPATVNLRIDEIEN